MSDMLRITGLATGLDTESMISKLMQAETIRVDKVKQQRQYVEWKRDYYREISNLLRGFKDDYFNFLNPSTNFRSSSTFSAYETTSSDTSVVEVTAGGSANSGTYDVVVNTLASTAVKTSSSQVSGGFTGMTGTNAVDMSKMKQGKEFTITLDGVTKTITLDQDYSGFTESNFATSLQGLIDNEFGSGKITVSESVGNLTFSPALTSSTLSIGDSTNTYLSTLGFSNGQDNTIISGVITDFTGGNFKISIDGGATVDINVVGAADRTNLVANINASLSAAGVDTTVKAIEDPDSSDKIKFLTLDTSKEVEFTSGDTDDMLAKVGISSGAKVTVMDGTINYSTDDIGKDFYITINGTQHHIDLEYDYTSDGFIAPNGRTLQEEIQTQLDSGGATGVTVNITGGKISFSNPNGDEIKIESGDAGLRDELGFTSTQTSSRISLSSTMEDADLATKFDFSGGDLAFTINGVSFTASKTDKLSDIINEINTSSAGVKITYSSLEDKFTMESNNTGATSVINNSDDTGNFFAALNIDTVSEVRGVNATATIDGINIERTTNDFSIDGVEYKLKSTGTSTVAIEANPDDVIKKIKSFVEKYNEVISTINNRTSEKRDYDYDPLTEDQKKEMSEDEIELWEEKAKSGILRSDSTLESITSSMRQALYDSVEGVGISLYDIGIKTSSYYQDKGKLVIDEEKLKTALKENLNEVVQLFTKDSDIEYDDSANRSQRYNEEGLAERLYDILEDNIRTTRNEFGRKGILLEKAGIENDISEFNNTLNTQIQNYDNTIDELLDDLADKETYYYNMFARMESAISQMNSQMSWLMSQTESM